MFKIDTDPPLDYGPQVKGWGPTKAQWISICSAHRNFDPSCNACKAGSWRNSWKGAIEHLVHEHAYPVWHWWANRKNSHFNIWLRTKKGKDTFPNMKGK